VDKPNRYAAQLEQGEECFTLHIGDDVDKLTLMLMTVLEKEPTGTRARIININTEEIIFYSKKQPIC